jgi:hypothetical protein
MFAHLPRQHAVTVTVELQPECKFSVRVRDAG